MPIRIGEILEAEERLDQAIEMRLAANTLGQVAQVLQKQQAAEQELRRLQIAFGNGEDSTRRGADRDQ